MIDLRTSEDWMRRLRRCLDTTLANALPAERALPSLLDGLAALARDTAAPRAATDSTAIDRYQRIGLADSVRPRYSALAIVWPPGHVSPVHDHGGLWGIELVVAGALDIDEYDVLAPQRLRHRHHARLAPGEGAWFGGQRFAHACRNASRYEAALTLHVYGGDLVNYTVYDDDYDSYDRIPSEARTVIPAAGTAQRHEANLIIE
jgi:predicted metal-dependent enzyme (double-stranded beta helix superfamily)